MAHAAVQAAADIDSEYEALRTGCGLVDRSHRGRLALTGPDAVEFLNGQVTNDITLLAPGEGCYAAFLTHKGKMLGDLRILKTEADPAPELLDSTREPLDPAPELLLETERVALQALFDMIRRFKIGYRLELHKRTLETTVLSLVGPTAGEITAIAAGEASAIPPPVEHSHRPATIAGVRVRAIATAEPHGIDILCDASSSDAVRSALIAAGATPASDQAAEIVRVEHGRPRYGLDLDETVIPQEAGLNERAVSFTKGCYLGQETVARLYYKGKPNRHLRGLALSTPLAAGTELFLGEKPVGTLTTSVLSPALGPIGLGLLRREAQVGASLAAPGATAEVVDLPFER